MSDDTEKPGFRLLDHLLKEDHPIRGVVGPRFLPDKRPECLAVYREPNYSWTRTEPGDEVITLDVNGAFLAPLSSVQLGFDALKHTGPMPFNRWPGYWLISTHQWSDAQIVSPLGRLKPAGRMWVATPLLSLLMELQEDGKWPGIEIYDSWLAEDREEPGKVSQWRPQAWAVRLGSMRRDLLTAREEAREQGDDAYAAADDEYGRFKVAYSQAIQIMAGPKPGHKPVAGIRRADWRHQIRAQHFANTWRKIWQLKRQGIPVMAWHGTDAIDLMIEDYQHLLFLYDSGAAPIKAFPKLDHTGHRLGQLKLRLDGETGDDGDDQ